MDKYQVETGEFSETLLLSKEITGPYWELMEDPFPECFQWAVEHPDIAEQHVVGVYYDDPAKKAPEKCRALMGVPVKEGAEVPEGYEVRKVEGILAAQTVYEGALGDMNKIKAYDALRKWIQENDAYVYDWTQPAIEIYLDSALKEGKKGRTRILFPIRKK